MEGIWTLLINAGTSEALLFHSGFQKLLPLLLFSNEGWKSTFPCFCFPSAPPHSYLGPWELRAPLAEITEPLTPSFSSPHLFGKTTLVFKCSTYFQLSLPAWSLEQFKIRRTAFLLVLISNSSVHKGKDNYNVFLKECLLQPKMYQHFKDMITETPNY